MWRRGDQCHAKSGRMTFMVPAGQDNQEEGLSHG